MVMSLLTYCAQTGRTALMYSCRGGHLGVVRALMDAGADRNATTKVYSGVGPVNGVFVWSSTMPPDGTSMCCKCPFSRPHALTSVGQQRGPKTATQHCPWAAGVMGREVLGRWAHSVHEGALVFATMCAVWRYSPDVGLLQWKPGCGARSVGRRRRQGCPKRSEWWGEWEGCGVSSGIHLMQVRGSSV